MSLHIYTRPTQPLTKWRDINLEVAAGLKRKHWFRTAPMNTRYACQRCRKRRRASSLGIQVYYDCLMIFCLDKKRCKR